MPPATPPPSLDPLRRCFLVIAGEGHHASVGKNHAGVGLSNADPNAGVVALWSLDPLRRCFLVIAGEGHHAWQKL